MARTDLGWLLEHVDNPMHEDRWSLGTQIADRAGISRRAISQKLVALAHEGFVEYQEQGPAPSAWSDKPPRLWRRVAAGTREDQNR